MLAPMATVWPSRIGRQLTLGGGSLARGLGLRDPGTRAVQVCLGGRQVDASGIAVDDHLRAVDKIQQLRARGDDRRQSQGARQDGRMRGGAAQRRRQAGHAADIQRGGIGRREIGGDQHDRVAVRGGLLGVAGERWLHVPQRAQADIAQVGRAGGQHRIAQRGKAFGLGLHRFMPGPGRAVARCHQLAGVGDQADVVEQAGLGLEDRGIGRAQALGGGIGQGLRFLAGSGQRGFQQRLAVE